MEPVNNSSFVFLFVEFDVSFGVFSDNMLDFAVVCDSAHFLLNVHVEFISDYMVVEGEVHLLF